MLSGGRKHEYNVECCTSCSKCAVRRLNARIQRTILDWLWTHSGLPLPEPSPKSNIHRKLGCGWLAGWLCVCVAGWLVGWLAANKPDCLNKAGYSGDETRRQKTLAVVAAAASEAAAA